MFRDGSWAEQALDKLGRDGRVDDERARFGSHRAHGAGWGDRPDVNTPDDVAPVMKKAFDTPGPVIVGVHVDYRDNHQLFETIKGDSFH
jgi:hypothetical protein